MSQVKFFGTRKGKVVEVVGGWDRPLREFFLNVFAEGESMDPIWSDLAVAPSLKQDTAFMRAKLAEMGIEVPEGFWERVERREANVLHVLHTGAGQAWQTF